MNVLLILGGLFVLYELVTKTQVIANLTSQANASASIASGTASAIAEPVPSYTAGTVSSSGAGNPSMFESINVTSAAVALNFVPVVGPILSAAFSAIAGGLMKASAQRAAAARNENNAVIKAVPGWDAGILQIVNAYNSGTITQNDALALLASPQTQANSITQSRNGILWQAYWQEVGPQVQSGRNACHTGADPHSPPLTHCSGDYGAGCCVAYDDLDNGLLYVAQAIVQAEKQPGVPVKSAMIPTVYSSKYGGVNRPGYSVTVQKPAPAASSIISL